MTGSGATPSGQETCGCGHVPHLGPSTTGAYRCLECSCPHLSTMPQVAPVLAHGPWCNGYLIGSCDCATRPTPPAPAQEAGSGRQAAVEAVARWLCAYLAPNFPGGPDAMDGDNGARFRLRATQILDLPEVAALSQPGEPT